MRMNRREVLKAGVATLVVAAGKESATAGEAPAEEKAASKAVRLVDHPITHGGVQQFDHPRLGTTVDGQTAIRYLRFGQNVHVDRLELRRLVYGRHVPQVPTHPARILVSMLDRESMTWKILREINLPPNPVLLGEGLSQDMTIEQMQERLFSVLNEPACVIELDGARTDHLRVVCNREHPIWPNHGECNGGEHNVPFGILNELRAYGVAGKTEVTTRVPRRVLSPRNIQPRAPKGMKVRMLPGKVLFEGKYLSIGFSLRRPMLMHLGWDALGQGQAGNNRLYVSRRSTNYNVTGGVSGPVLRTLDADYPASLWTGEVSVDGNRVAYTNLQAVEGLQIDAIFTVENDRFTVDLTQRCAKSMAVIEAEAWRLAWDLTLGITGMASLPTLRAGRNGDVALPGLWATDGVGCLSCAQIEGASSDVRMQVESYRESNCVTGGVVFGEHPGPDACQIVSAGARRAVFEYAVSNLNPLRHGRTVKGGTGLRRHWATVFSCFRPEFRGFSNHSASVNCHLSQGPPLEIVAHTERPEVGPNPLDLARFTIERALLDGGGYGYHRNLYLDSDPVLLSAAGRIHQADPNTEWLQRIEPGLVETVERMLAEAGNEGLLVCKDLSGNLGSFRWSSNSMDVVGFGHIDAYVNAWAYRAFRNAAAMLDALPAHRDLAAQCRDTATRLRIAYAPALVNPETGWVAGWRSRDGQLHDYGFTWVNGVALAFGLLDADAARTALVNMERTRHETGLPDARLGLPCNLLPIRADDQMWTKILNSLQPTFETYTDGSLSGWPATYYLRALSIYGLKEQARALATELADGYASGVFNGGNGTGHEFRSWEGLGTGYEGTLIGCFGPLYGIAIEEGILEPSNPEWWPENG
ncbi:MAG: hypothetical protein IT365_23150 [Candidatus Hydrogenedentes bacterium]|nr:hypothetical protein [Candidatus Hydrogenedentota bacterium]